MYGNFGFRNDSAGRYHYQEGDAANDDLDRAVAEQVVARGGQFDDFCDPATINAALMLQNRTVNIGLPWQGQDQQQLSHHGHLINPGARGIHQYQQQQQQQQHGNMEGAGPQYGARNRPANLNQLSDEELGALSNNEYASIMSMMESGFDNTQQQQSQESSSARGGRLPGGLQLHQQHQPPGGGSVFGDTGGTTGLDYALHDIMAFNKEHTSETVCSKLEKIMPFYDESLYYACKEYIFQHALYHKHHLRSIGLSGVPLRYRLLSLWQRPLATNVGKCYFFFETLLVGMSLVQVVLETVPAYSTIVSAGWARTWLLMELPTSACFILDIIVHVSVLPSFPNDYSVYSRSSFVKSIEFWIDVGSILPTIFIFLALFFPLLAAFDFLKILRVLRFGKVLRQFSSVDQLANTVERSFKPLVAPFVFLFVSVMITSGLIFYAEHGDYDEQKKMFMQPDCDCESSAPAVLNPYYKCPPRPTTILSVPHAMWYAVVTMSTVGYGDLYPRCLLGRIVGTFTILCGTVLLAMPIAIVGTYFTDVVAQSQRSSAAAHDLEKSPFQVPFTGDANGEDGEDGDATGSRHTHTNNNNNNNNNSITSSTAAGGEDINHNNNDDDLDDEGGASGRDGSDGVYNNNSTGSVQNSSFMLPSAAAAAAASSSASAPPTSAATTTSFRLRRSSLVESEKMKRAARASADSLRRSLAPKSDTPGVRLIHFLADCKHNSVALLDPTPLIIHQINSFVKKEIEMFLRSLLEPGRAKILKRDFYNSTTNFTLVPYLARSQKEDAVIKKKRAAAARAALTGTVAGARAALQMAEGEEDDAENDHHDTANSIFLDLNNSSNSADADLMMLDELERRDPQKAAELRKSRLAARLAEDDYAHDVRVALSQKGDKAPICLRTMPIVLCGPTMALQFMGASDAPSMMTDSLVSSSSSFAPVPGAAGSSSSGGGGGGSPGAGGSGGGAASGKAADGKSGPAGGCDGNNTHHYHSHHSSLLRGYPSGASLLPYCAPGCEIHGVPSPFAILWVCPMTNFVSITAVFPVIVTVNGREAPYETPQRLLFGDTICIHAGSAVSRPLLTYRFARAEAPLIPGAGRGDQATTAGDNTGDKNRRSNNSNAPAGAKKKPSAAEEENLPVKKFRVRSLPEQVPEYRAYPLSKYSTTFNSGASEFHDL